MASFILIPRRPKLRAMEELIVVIKDLSSMYKSVEDSARFEIKRNLRQLPDIPHLLGKQSLQMRNVQTYWKEIVT